MKLNQFEKCLMTPYQPKTRNLAAAIAEIKKRPSRTIPPVIRPNSMAQNLLKYAGSWEGSDLESCLQFVHETRSKAEF